MKVFCEVASSEVMVGASLTAVTLTSTVVRADHCELWSSVPRFCALCTLATAASETRTDSAGGVPLKSPLPSALPSPVGRKRK